MKRVNSWKIAIFTCPVHGHGNLLKHSADLWGKDVLRNAHRTIEENPAASHWESSVVKESCFSIEALAYPVASGGVGARCLKEDLGMKSTNLSAAGDVFASTKFYNAAYSGIVSLSTTLCHYFLIFYVIYFTFSRTPI
jgi:hypothetical protein